MSVKEDKRAYVIDTNVLIQLYYWYPLKFSKNFWSQIEKLLESGSWVFLNVVKGEIHYISEFNEWIKKQEKKGLVITIDDEVRNRSVEINDKYSMIDQGGKSEVDTYIIAFAEINNMKIFTREGFRKNENDLYKIPDVCKKLDIAYTRIMKTFMNQVGFRLQE